ncbi:MAG: PA14 domain-containing protein [Gammaproteobacteria bacterium]
MTLLSTAIGNTDPAVAATFTTVGSELADPCGEPFLIRGVNSGIAFPADPGAKNLAQIAKTGANTVRLTFRWAINKSDPQAVAIAIRRAAENNMLAIPSIWDATGKWSMFPFAVDFWSQPDMVAELRKFEDLVLLNIANEAGGGEVTNDQYRQGYLQAIYQLRNAGLHMPLVIDAANWGRRESDILQNAKYLIEHDPDHNLVFSWHPWDTKQPPARYEKAFKSAHEAGIPLIIGEFSSTGVSYKLPIDYRYLMQHAADHKVGWLWWWWTSGSEIDGHALTQDGIYGHWANVGEEVVMASQYGIQATSLRTPYLKDRTCAGRENATLLPAAPSNLQAESTQGAEITLSWQDNSSDEKNFDIEVYDSKSDAWRLLKVVGPNTESVTLGANLAYIYSLDSSHDPSLGYQTSYRFRVGAYKAKNAISYSDSAGATTGANVGTCSNGDGLKGEYFSAEHRSQDFTQYVKPSLVRIDSNIDFSWKVGSPDPQQLSNDHFQVRWTGYIEPQFSGEYAFYTNSDDFARVWIDDEQVIDNWRAFAGGWATGKAKLVAGKRYSIRVEYREWDRFASMRLYWSSPQLVRELVPQCRLFSS